MMKSAECCGTTYAPSNPGKTSKCEKQWAHGGRNRHQIKMRTIEQPHAVWDKTRINNDGLDSTKHKSGILECV